MTETKTGQEDDKLYLLTDKELARRLRKSIDYAHELGNRGYDVVLRAHRPPGKAYGYDVPLLDVRGYVFNDLREDRYFITKTNTVEL